jgi:predicted DNA-binding transcriptional regulator AlpA
MTALIQTERPTRQLGDAKAVGRVLDLSWRTVYRLADQGKIPSGFKLGASRRWDLTQIEEFIRDGCKPPKTTPKGVRS